MYLALFSSQWKYVATYWFTNLPNLKQVISKITCIVGMKTERYLILLGCRINHWLFQIQNNPQNILYRAAFVTLLMLLN